MTVHVLIVEDEADFVDELRQVFAELPVPISVSVAGSRDTAISALETEFFDLIVLDLKIPTIDGALDAAPTHGHSVFARAMSVAPGTPALVLTGSPVEDFIPAMLAGQQQVDIWGEGRRVGNVDFLQKYRFDECPAKLEQIVSAVHRLSEVELDRGGLNLSLPEERLIRIFSRKFDGAHCAATQLGGGLSGAKVLRLRVSNAAGALVHDAVAKLGSPEEIRDEATRFDNFVSRLDPGATPRKLAALDFGAGAVAGVFYGLAAGFEVSAFDIARNQDGGAQAAVRGIAAAIAPWNRGVPQSRRSLREVRRRVLSDEDLALVRLAFPLAWIDVYEANMLQTCWACVHGDLHGSNALISTNGSAVVIDYGDVAEGPASLDPVTLELSVIFHPQGVDLAGWPTMDQARRWGEVEAYLENCPVAEFIRSCREWAREVAAGNREIAAVAYSYLIRQLKYEDTNKDLALNLIDGVRAFYDQT